MPASAISKKNLSELHHLTQAILFDLDGTLLDSTDLILQCFRHSWETVCGFNHSREALVETFGTPLRSAMHRLLLSSAATNADFVAQPDGEVTNRVIDRLLTEYRTYNLANHDQLARPFLGTCEVLAELRRRGYSIGLVTSKSRELALRGLRLCSLETLIDSSVFLEDTQVHKPNPEPILAVLSKLGRPAHTAAYVGDSQHDIVAARAAGVLSVAALWGPSPRNDLERENPDLVAEAISDLLEFFN